jgi:DNA (cytosine-5)-methyltransferase 1
MTRRLLDLFCGAGGCAKGYQRAGFFVVGVDNRPQPHYCGDGFVLADALEAMRVLLAGGYITDSMGRKWYLKDFDAIHASPPCQGYCRIRGMGKGAGRNTPMLVGEVRELLLRTGLEYVIENVPGAPLKTTIVLCGSMFGLPLRRHRLFETNFMVMSKECRHQPNAIAVYGDHPEDAFIHRRSKSTPGCTKRAASIDIARKAMGIDWMDWKEITQSIPPAYTEFIGAQLMQYLSRSVPA